MIQSDRPISAINDPAVRLREGAKRTVVWLMLLGVGLIMMYPLLWMFGTSVKTVDPQLIEQFGHDVTIFPTDHNILGNLFPEKWHWRNYLTIFDRVPFARYYLNSILIAAVATISNLVTCSLAAYAFARLQFKGRDALFICYLGTLMIPSTVTLIPTFILFSRIGLVDTYWAMMLPSMFSAYGTFMLRQFFLTLPRELEEAAVIDGCGLFRIYRSIVLPLSTSALATLAIFIFLGNWGGLLTPLVMVSSEQIKPLPLGLLSFTDEYTADWPLMMAASILSILPVIVVFLFGQRFLIAGIRLGAVKG